MICKAWHILLFIKNIKFKQNHWFNLRVIKMINQRCERSEKELRDAFAG